METATSEPIDFGQSDENPQIIFSWKAPLRPYKKPGKNIIRFYIALALLLSLIVYFFGDKILLVVIWSILFLFYSLTIWSPPDVENKITKFGIETAGITLRWEALSHFYFSERFGFEMLILVSHSPYNLHSYLVVPNNDVKQKVKNILSEHIMYQQTPEKTVTDTMIDWMLKLIPDDDEMPVRKEEKSPPSPINHTPLSSSFQIPQEPFL